MAEIVSFPGITKLDVPVERILDKARTANLSEVVVIGTDSDGDFYFASSQAGGHDVLWLLERAKHKLMQISDELEGGGK